MRRSVMAALVAGVAAGCTELPVEPLTAPAESPATAPAAQDAPRVLALPEERMDALTVALEDARGRLLPALEGREALGREMAALDAALASGDAERVTAAAAAALDALAQPPGDVPGDTSAELDAIRLVVSEVMEAAAAR